MICPKCGHMNDIIVLSVLIGDGRIHKYRCNHCNHTWRVGGNIKYRKSYYSNDLQRPYPDPVVFCCDKLKEQWETRDEDGMRKIRVSDYAAFSEIPHRFFISDLHSWISFCPFCGTELVFEELKDE